MSNEKKTKLDELPNEGRSSKTSSHRLNNNKEKTEPRIQKLKTLDDKSKVQVMVQRWHFDKEEQSYGWVLYILILLMVEFSPLYQNYLHELESMNQSFFDIGGNIIRSVTNVFESVIRHPTILILLTPLIFKFSHPSEYKFHITFDGIDTVKKVLPKGAKEYVSRTFIKWNEITLLKKVKIKQKEVLKLYSGAEHVGDVIWHIDKDKKRAIRMLLNGMIIADHPVRVFLEKEKEKDKL
jgi:hypothetical protein